MSLPTTHLDMTSVEGVILSFIFIALAKVFLIFEVISFLQAVSYILAILAAGDTMFGGPLKSFLTSKYKGIKTKMKNKKKK